MAHAHVWPRAAGPVHYRLVGFIARAENGYHAHIVWDGTSTAPHTARAVAERVRHPLAVALYAHVRRPTSWSPHTHWMYPAQFREQARTLLLIWWARPESNLARLPSELFFYVLELLAPPWPAEERLARDYDLQHVLRRAAS
jgi:hypothetical protein